MKSYASGKVEIEETAKMYAVTGEDIYNDEAIHIYTSKEKAEDKLTEFNQDGHDSLSVAFLYEGDTLGDLQRKLV